MTMHHSDFSPGLTQLFVQAAKLPLLTPKQEIEHGRRARRGDLVSRNALVEHNIRLAVKLAKSHRNRGVPFEDLVQEAMLGLHRAAEKFDPERGFRFTTYATWWITHFCQRCVQNKSTTIRIPAQVLARRARILRHLDGNPDATVAELAEVAECTPAQAREASQAARVVASLDAPTGSAGGSGDDDDDDAYGRIADPDAPSPEDAHVRDDRVTLALAQLPGEERDVVRLRFGFDGPVRSRKEISNALGIDERAVSRHQRQGMLRLRAILSGADGGGPPRGATPSSHRPAPSDLTPVCVRTKPPEEE